MSQESLYEDGPLLSVSLPCNTENTTLGKQAGNKGPKKEVLDIEINVEVICVRKFVFLYV